MKEKQTLSQVLENNPIIPSTHQRKELLYVLEKTKVEWVMLKLGDINTLPKLVKIIHHFGKRVMVHQDSIKGIARDKMGIQYMADCGVDALITMKPLCIKMIKEAGIISIFGFFIIDSDAMGTGIKNIKEHQPEGVILMPGTIPEEIIKIVIKESKVPVILGGLITKNIQIEKSLQVGVKGIATSELDLWPT